MNNSNLFLQVSRKLKPSGDNIEQKKLLKIVSFIIYSK